MEFIVEDGSGLVNATSYVSVAYADDYVGFYHPNDTEWASKTVPEKELLLVNATTFIDSLVKWAGTSYKFGQSLRWPRSGFKDTDGRLVEAGTVPDKIKQAVVAVALESISGDIYDEGVLITSQKYGSSSETYAGPVRDGGNAVILRLLKEFKESGYGSNKTSMITLQRA